MNFEIIQFVFLLGLTLIFLFYFAYAMRLCISINLAQFKSLDIISKARWLIGTAGWIILAACFLIGIPIGMLALWGGLAIMFFEKLIR